MYGEHMASLICREHLHLNEILFCFIFLQMTILINVLRMTSLETFENDFYFSAQTANRAPRIILWLYCACAIREAVLALKKRKKCNNINSYSYNRNL